MKRFANTSAGGVAVRGETVRSVRRFVGLEREYRCSAGHEHRSWNRVRACPQCGESLAVAVIRRVAVVWPSRGLG
jgi:hypothetical protein